MSTGVWALIGAFALAVGCMAWNARVRRSVRRRLEALGFVPGDGEIRALTETWHVLVSSTGGRRDVRLSSCLARPSGAGPLHHVDVQDVTHHDDRRDGAHVGASWSAYVFELRDPRSIHRGAVALYLARGGSVAFRALLRRTLGIDPPGAALEIGAHPWADQIVAAFGVAPGKLDDVVPPTVQERLARAADHGFFLVHVAAGKAAFSVLPGRRDVGREWAYLAEWV